MNLGQQELMKRYGTRVELAKALIRGELSAYHEEISESLLNMVYMAAAVAQLQSVTSVTKGKCGGTYVAFTPTLTGHIHSCNGCGHTKIFKAEIYGKRCEA